jgi:hypothetical protein
MSKPEMTDDLRAEAVGYLDINDLKNVGGKTELKFERVMIYQIGSFINDIPLYTYDPDAIGLQQALRRLVLLKDYKNKNGKDSFYDREQDEAWNEARNALINTPPSPPSSRELLEKVEPWMPKLGDLVNPSASVCEKYVEWKPNEVLKIVGINYGRCLGSLWKYTDDIEFTVIEVNGPDGPTDGWKLEDLRALIPQEPKEEGNG